MSRGKRRHRAPFGDRPFRFGNDRRGVSPVVGTLLMYAIFITTAATMRTAIVPNLDEGREASEMAVVAERFASLKMDADRQLSDGHINGASTLIPMRAQAPSHLLSNGQSATTLAFIADRQVTLEAHELRVQSEDDRVVVGAMETWTNVTETTTIQNILDIKHLRVRVLDPQSEADQDSMTLTLYDDKGSFAGEMKVYVKHHPSGYSVDVKVKDAASSVLFDQGNSYFSQDRPPFYWVDALDDHMQFADVISRTKGPFSLRVSEEGLIGAFTITYVEDTPGGRVLTGTGGSTYHGWTHTQIGMSLHYEAPNLRFLSQEYLLESGGVIVEQSVGDTFLVEPGLDVEKAQDRTTLRVSVPTLVGSPGEWAGMQDMSVRVNGANRTALLATAPHFAMNVTTDHPHVWATFWTGKFAAAGLAPGEFAVTSGDGWARFDVYGHDSAPGSSTHDLAVDLHHGTVALVIGG